MIDYVLKFIAPHHCYACGKIGKCLCKSCKYYIIDDPLPRCLSCLKPTNQVCSLCSVSYTKTWCVGALDGALKDLIYDFKFKNLKHGHLDLCDLLIARVAKLPNNIIVTSVPTLPSHIRKRGYDHTKLLARRFAKKSGLKYNLAINRVSKTSQQNAPAKVRWIQAKNAFEAKKVIKDATYLLIDDIVTTGATIEHASKCLLQAGAGEVWVAILARQTLD